MCKPRTTSARSGRCLMGIKNDRQYREWQPRWIQRNVQIRVHSPYEAIQMAYRFVGTKDQLAFRGGGFIDDWRDAALPLAADDGAARAGGVVASQAHCVVGVSSRRRKLDGVAQKILKDLFDLPGIATAGLASRAGEARATVARAGGRNRLASCWATACSRQTFDGIGFSAGGRPLVTIQRPQALLLANARRRTDFSIRHGHPAEPSRELPTHIAGHH